MALVSITLDCGKTLQVTRHVARLVEDDKNQRVPQRTPEWYEKRRQHLTCSQIAAVIGCNPYESRQSALRKKCGVETPFQGSAATEHGNKYEAVALQRYEEITGERALEFGLLESLDKSKHGFLAGSPDAITASGRLVEIKCPFRRKFKVGDPPPIYYVPQIQTLMSILDLEVCDFVTYRPATTWQNEVISIVEVKRDDEWFATYFPVMRRFWEDVIAVRDRGEVQLLEDPPGPVKAKETKLGSRSIQIAGPEPKCFLPLPNPSDENATLPSRTTLDHESQAVWEIPESFLAALERRSEELISEDIQEMIQRAADDGEVFEICLLRP